MHRKGTLECPWCGRLVNKLVSLFAPPQPHHQASSDSSITTRTSQGPQDAPLWPQEHTDDKTFYALLHTMMETAHSTRYVVSRVLEKRERGPAEFASILPLLIRTSPTLTSSIYLHHSNGAASGTPAASATQAISAQPAAAAAANVDPPPPLASLKTHAGSSGVIESDDEDDMSLASLAKNGGGAAAASSSSASAALVATAAPPAPKVAAAPAAAAAAAAAAAKYVNDDDMPISKLFRNPPGAASANGGSGSGATKKIKESEGGGGGGGGGEEEKKKKKAKAEASKEKEDEEEAARQKERKKKKKDKERERESSSSAAAAASSGSSSSKKPSSRSSGSSKSAAHGARTQDFYQLDKGELVQKLLRRWWYAMEWPDPACATQVRRRKKGEREEGGRDYIKFWLFDGCIFRCVFFSPLLPSLTSSLRLLPTTRR